MIISLFSNIDFSNIDYGAIYKGFLLIGGLIVGVYYSIKVIYYLIIGRGEDAEELAEKDPYASAVYHLLHLPFYILLILAFIFVCFYHSFKGMYRIFDKNEKIWDIETVNFDPFAYIVIWGLSIPFWIVILITEFINWVLRKSNI